MENLLKKLGLNNLFGEGDIIYGKALSETRDLHDYFQRISKNCGGPIKNIIERFNPQKIVSIASGIGVEEIEFEKYGCEV